MYLRREERSQGPRNGGTKGRTTLSYSLHTLLYCKVPILHSCVHPSFSFLYTRPFFRLGHPTVDDNPAELARTLHPDALNGSLTCDRLEKQGPLETKST